MRVVPSVALARPRPLPPRSAPPRCSCCPAPCRHESVRNPPGSGLPACDPDNGGLTLPGRFLRAGGGRRRSQQRTPRRRGGQRGHLRSQPGARAGAAPSTPVGGVFALRGTPTATGGRKWWSSSGDKLRAPASSSATAISYISTSTEVFRYALTPGQLVPAGPPELMVSEFPMQRGHRDKPFAFDDDGEHVRERGRAVERLPAAAADGRLAGTPALPGARAAGERLALRRGPAGADAGGRRVQVRAGHAQPAWHRGGTP